LTIICEQKKSQVSSHDFEQKKNWGLIGDLLKTVLKPEVTEFGLYVATTRS